MGATGHQALALGLRHWVVDTYRYWAPLGTDKLPGTRGYQRQRLLYSVNFAKIMLVT